MQNVSSDIRYPSPGFDLRAYIDTRRPRVEQLLRDIIDANRTWGQHAGGGRLIDAMRYSLMAGGKRLRPILCLAAAETVGVADDRVLSAAAALEMIHTYSLIHDDLPAMDNDDLRRGKPTCHLAFDEATAILAGDALLTLAFESLAGAAARDDRPHVDWFRIIAKIAQASGCRGMIEGQMRDIASEGTRLSPAEVADLHALKTGALIEASLFAGAVLGGADSEQTEDLCRYARHIGLAFQVADDILNVEGDPVVLGKAVGTDDAMGKNTYPAMMGMESARAFGREQMIYALQAIGRFDNRAEPLRAIACYIVDRKR